MAKRFGVWSGVVACFVAVLAAVPGCSAPSFQIFFMNVGHYPVVSILVVPANAQDWGPERLKEAVPVDGSVLLRDQFARGAMYDVAVIFNVAPETVEGDLKVLTTQVDTSALNEGYVTLWAALRRDGGNGAGYDYGLPE